MSAFTVRNETLQLYEFPQSLGCPIDIASFYPGESFDVSEFEHGNRYRKRYCSTYTLEVAFAFSKTQMTNFRMWYYDYLGGGAESFLADWDVEGDTAMKIFHHLTPYTVKRQKGNPFYLVQAKFELQTNIN